MWLVGCTSLPPPEPASLDFRPPLGEAANRVAGTVLTLTPPSVRLADRTRNQPVGVTLVARDSVTLRPRAVLKVDSTQGSIARVLHLRGTLQLGDEVVEPSGDLMLEANQLPGL